MRWERTPPDTCGASLTSSTREPSQRSSCLISSEKLLRKPRKSLLKMYVRHLQILTSFRKKIRHTFAIEFEFGQFSVKEMWFRFSPIQQYVLIGSVFLFARFTHGFMMEMLQLKMLKSQTNLLKTSIQKLKDRLDTQKRHEQFKVDLSPFLPPLPTCRLR